MWCCRRIFLFVPLLLAGCGFQPLYAPSGEAGARSALDGIKVEIIADRSGQMLRTMLLDRMNPSGLPDSPRYRLEVNLRQTSAELALRADAAGTRGDVQVQANYVLRDAASGEAVLTGISRAASGYDIVQSPYASLVARQAGRDRSLRVIADDIANRLAVHLTRPKSESKAP